MKILFQLLKGIENFQKPKEVRGNFSIHLLSTHFRSPILPFYIRLSVYLSICLSACLLPVCVGMYTTCGLRMCTERNNLRLLRTTLIYIVHLTVAK